MIFWCYLSAVCADPGKPPAFWGFYLENPEDKRRNYCAYCHTYKPERCHHCSTCGRCVLNMDHHCPWLHNCIGFFNRKYFMLLLFYTWISLLLGTIFACIRLKDPFTSVVIKEYTKDTTSVLDLLFGVMAIVAMGILFVIMTIFIKYHVELISNNSTTLENLEEQRSGPSMVSYDHGIDFNWNQVFGKDKLLWPIPYFFELGR